MRPRRPIDQPLTTSGSPNPLRRRLPRTLNHQRRHRDRRTREHQPDQPLPLAAAESSISMKNHRALLLVASLRSRTLGGLVDVSSSADRQQHLRELHLDRRALLRACGRGRGRRRERDDREHCTRRRGPLSCWCRLLDVGDRGGDGDPPRPAGTKIVMLTASAEIDDFLAALRAGRPATCSRASIRTACRSRCSAPSGGRRRCQGRSCPT
jgi:hypothetical protein